MVSLGLLLKGPPSYPSQRAKGSQCLKALIGLEGAHAFNVSIFGGVEHLRDPAGWRVLAMRPPMDAGRTAEDHSEMVKERRELQASKSEALRRH